ncbi:hypothetical protein WPS_05750 [Vulcanimicrobium alpinum]|uniref:Uncharacterized protein n=1 Tax=Vulcanimicrobium alpinum TaxID=3016050 RepID=A0AAN1XTF0_UNVUL|nr:hypothetical protein [Vulcanimicrobium alpinum]BDE05299.1 hypothetical protein WPS_05750 [Vulcanimicrobium alpinum]
MPGVALVTTIAAPQAAVAPRLMTVLSAYAQRDDFALAARVGFAGATLNVPVKLWLVDPSSRTADAIPIAMAAARHEDWFPVFSGEVRAAAGGRMESSLQLNGEYRVPLGAFGRWSTAPRSPMPPNRACGRFCSACAPTSSTKCNAASSRFAGTKASPRNDSARQ